MISTDFRFLSRLLACALLVAATAEAQVTVTTYKNDNNRSGQNTQEVLLNTTNVNSTQFGKLFTTAVDGYVYAQPLYLANVNIAGGTHNVLYVVTEHDSLYAIDADSGTVLWQQSFINPGAGITSVTQGTACTDIVPEIGITSTPVIDPTTNTIYLVTKTQQGTSTYVQQLHAVDVGSGAEKFGGPVTIQASVPGTGNGSVGGVVSFDPLKENQRAALLLENGHVVIAWASHCDNGPYHGWVMSYSASTLAQEAVFNTTPNSGLGGIWMAGDGVDADANGNLYLATGNGDYNGSTEWGDTLLKLGPPSGGTFPILDWFTPYNQNNMMLGDGDLGSGGLILLPDLPAGSAHQQQLVQMGKLGSLYELDRNNLGKYCSSCTVTETLIPEDVIGATKGVWGSPAYWNGSIYWGGGRDNPTNGADYLKAFSFNANGSGLVSTQPTSMSAKQFLFGTGSPVVSANNDTNGIVWLTDNSTYASACCQTLYAYDATNLTNQLYNSGLADDRRDVPGGAVKFTAPTVANGKVYVGGQYAVTGYGLLTSANASVASLTTTPNPAYYGQTVTLSAGVTSTLSGTPTGSITFADNNQTLAIVPMVNAQATYSTSLLGAGNHALSAAYSGDSNFGPSTLSIHAQTMRQVNSVTPLTSSQNPSFVGQSVQFTATIVPPFGGPATGTVTFKHGTATLAVVPVTNNSAAYSEVLTTPGGYGVVAVYSGDANVRTNSGSVSQVVQQYPTSTTLTASPNPSNFGQTVTLTATVTSANPTGPTKTVAFYNGTTLLGTATLRDGVAILKTIKLPTGTDTLTANYSGDTADAKSSSAAVTQTVNQATSSLMLKSSRNPSPSGNTIQLTATLTSAGKILTSQTVTFASNGTVLGTAVTNSAGAATFSTNSLSIGANTITATYAGNTNYSSASASISQSIQ